MERIEIKSDKPNFLMIGDEEYILDTEKIKKVDGVWHGDRIVFKKFDRKKYTEDLNIIIEAIGRRVTKEELLMDIINKIPAKDVRALAKRIRLKKPIKKQKGCVGFKIGEKYLPILD